MHPHVASWVVMHTVAICAPVLQVVQGAQAFAPAAALYVEPATHSEHVFGLVAASSVLYPALHSQVRSACAVQAPTSLALAGSHTVHEEHTPSHSPFTLSHASACAASLKPSLHWHAPATSALFGGHCAALPSSHAAAPAVDEYVHVSQSMHEPADMALCPTKPRPEPHTVWASHALMSMPAFHVPFSAPPQASHSMSAELLPLPATRPSPVGQFFHGWQLSPCVARVAALE